MKIKINNIRHLENPACYYAAGILLTPDRKESLERIRNEADRLRSLAAGELLMDAFLDSYPNRLRDEIGTVATGSHGKPYLKDYPDWKYNISHSGDYAAIVYDDYPISVPASKINSLGIDIQKKRNITDGVAGHLLCDNEYELIMSMADENKKQTILNAIWSVKEAYIKYTGLGLSFDMKQAVLRDIKAFINMFSGSLLVKGSYADLFLESTNGSYPGVSCRYYYPADDYHLSVCSDSGDFPENIIEI